MYIAIIICNIAIAIAKAINSCLLATYIIYLIKDILIV